MVFISKDEGLVFVEVWVFVFKMGIWLVVLLVAWLSEVGCICEVGNCHGRGVV